MAVFMLNICKFNDCGLTFKNLGRLIQHIEETHIDYDPQVVEEKEKQQPSCVPLSYVLRFFTDAARREIMKPLQVQTRPSNCHTSSVRIKNDSPSEIEGDEDFTSEPDDSNDSWAMTEEFSTDFILRYRNRGANRSLPTETSIDKPFACPVPGCKKRYKNVNGIKYHSKNGHKNDGKIIRKAFKCPCGKNYKTQYGLKNHININHGNSLSNLKFLRSEMEIDQEERISQEETTLTEEIKFSAMEDHVYVKQNRSRERDCESLGILTPASTPPLSTQSTTKIGSTVYDRQVRSYHNYFTVQNSDRDYNN